MTSKKSNSFIPALMLATAGVGVGNLTANLGQEEAIAPVPAPTEQVRVYEQELHHGADSSLEKGLGLDNVTNADVLKVCLGTEELRIVNTKQKAEIVRLKSLNTKALKALKDVQSTKTHTNAVKQYYGG